MLPRGVLYFSQQLIVPKKIIDVLKLIKEKPLILYFIAEKRSYIYIILLYK